MISARLQPVSRELELAVRGDLARDVRALLVANVAREDIAEIDRVNDAAVGTDVHYRTFVNGSASEQFESVDPDRGAIAAAWDLGTDVVAQIGAMLREHSPVGSGKDPHPGLYKSSHLLFADGVQVDAPDPSLNVSEWAYISGVPYARKIERGQGHASADGVYEGVAALARRRYGNQAKINFTFRSLAAGGSSALSRWASSTSSGGHIRNAARRSDWLQRQPAIVITLR